MYPKNKDEVTIVGRRTSLKYFGKILLGEEMKR